MVSNAWYTVNYFHVSFGKQDKLQRAIEALIDFEGMEVDANLKVVKERLMQTDNKATVAELNYFNSQVPHWFLAPWFPKADRVEIYSGSNDYLNDCLYSLSNDSLTINPNWIHYLTTNARVLKDFCYWNLTLYLQTKNPNVPDIAGKLIRPALRNSLRDQRVNFWNVVINEIGSIDCIYTGKRLTVGDYAVEHFVPFAFVAHDLIWNLIPADIAFNCSKSDKLPRLDTYFEPFYRLQATAIEIVQHVNPKNKYLEDYLTILPELTMFTNNNNRAKQRYREQLQPLLTIAANNGFEYLSL
ncbi:HNH endonuclease domain-containing protein [Mucilaginibacter galii]|nr:HNH endonuclease domain-containing protein [Mucilaginibacter galii]